MCSQSDDQDEDLIKQKLKISANLSQPVLFQLSQYNDEYSDPELESENEEDMDTLTELDRRNLNKPAKVPLYAEKIFTNALKDVYQSDVDPLKFESVQTEITVKNRELAIKWLFQLHQEFQLSSDTLYLAIEYLDIVLSHLFVPKAQLQLFTVTCAWISTKVEENIPPKLMDMCDICSNKIQNEDFIECEKKILEILDFKLNYPTPKLFLRRYLDVVDADSILMEISNFFLEIAVMCGDLIGQKPEVKALAATCSALIALGEVCPTKKLMQYAHLSSIEQVRLCMDVLMSRAREILSNSEDFLFKRYTIESLECSIRKISPASCYVTNFSL